MLKKLLECLVAVFLFHRMALRRELLAQCRLAPCRSIRNTEYCALRSAARRLRSVCTRRRLRALSSATARKVFPVPPCTPPTGPFAFASLVPLALVDRPQLCPRILAVTARPLGETGIRPRSAPRRSARMPRAAFFQITLAKATPELRGLHPQPVVVAVHHHEPGTTRLDLKVVDGKRLVNRRPRRIRPIERRFQPLLRLALRPALEGFKALRAS